MDRSYGKIIWKRQYAKYTMEKNIWKTTYGNDNMEKKIRQ